MDMQNKMSLKNARFPKMLGDLMHTNQFLKVFSISTLALMFLLLSMMAFVTMKEPQVITLATNGSSLSQVELPKAEDQIKEAVNYYLRLRYYWNPENVKMKMLEAEAFIAPTSVKAFKMAASNIASFSTGKVVSQKVFPEKVVVDLTKRVAIITGDRLTTIQGMKAAGGLKLELTFESGSRTKENPWGLYITKEREE